VFALRIPAFAQERPPPILEVYREFWKPGNSTANHKIEAEAAQICIELKSPHPYLGLESLTGPQEAWFLNGYASSTEQTQVGDDYQKNPALIRALKQILMRKKPLSSAEDVNVFAKYQQSLNRGAPWSLGQGRFLVITVTKRDLAAKSKPEIDGTAFEVDDGTLFIFSAARTRQEAEARSGGRPRDTRLRGSCVLEPARQGLDRHGSFVLEGPTNRNERQINYLYSHCLRAHKNYVGSKFPLQTRLVRMRTRELV
jgi:hypothetical protein